MAARLAATALVAVLAVLNAARAALSQTAAATVQARASWEVVAGGKQEFEVASIRQSEGKFRPPNFPLDNGDAYASTGGRFSADFPLLTYVHFAYKVSFTEQQTRAMLEHLPKWVAADRFEIQARAENSNPTKDQSA